MKDFEFYFYIFDIAIMRIVHLSIKRRFIVVDHEYVEVAHIFIDQRLHIF